VDCSAHPPQGHEGQDDSQLHKILRRLQQAIAGTQQDFAHDTLRLSPVALSDLAGILVDFAEDLHAGAGIWAAYERYNTELIHLSYKDLARLVQPTVARIPLRE
jgi:hypothetical protein